MCLFSLKVSYAAREILLMSMLARLEALVDSQDSPGDSEVFREKSKFGLAKVGGWDLHNIPNYD